MVYGPIAAALVEFFPPASAIPACRCPITSATAGSAASAATSFAMVAQTGDIYFGLWYPIVVALMTFVIGRSSCPRPTSGTSSSSSSCGPYVPAANRCPPGIKRSFAGIRVAGLSRDRSNSRSVPHPSKPIENGLPSQRMSSTWTFTSFRGRANDTISTHPLAQHRLRRRRRRHCLPDRRGFALRSVAIYRVPTGCRSAVLVLQHRDADRPTCRHPCQP